MKFIFININDWIIIHFGINPKKGGKPPKDNIDINKKIFNI